MTPKGTGRSEFSQFVSHHLIADKHGNVLATIVNGDCVTHHQGQDSGGSRPRFDYFFFIAGVQPFNFFEQAVGDEGSLF